MAVTLAPLFCACHPMASRRPVLLTPSMSLRLIQALSCTQQKLNPFVVMQFRTLCEKHPGVGYPPLHCSLETARPRIPLSKVIPPIATVTTLDSAILFPPRESLAGIRQKYRTDPQRAIPDRESARRKPGFSRADKGLSVPRPHDSCPQSCRQQFCPAHCFLSDRHARTSVLWDFNTCCAGGRRHDGDCERLGIAEEQGGSGSRERSAAKSESAGHFSECLLSTDVAAHRRPGVDLRGDHPWGQ